MRYVTGVDEKDRPIDLRDPKAAELRVLADAAGRDAERLVGALVSLQDVFGSDLSVDPRFTRAVGAALDKLLKGGAERAVAELARSA
jgi:fructuronate reductase